MTNSNGMIRIVGARTHNLKNVDIDIPRGRLVVITGVSGSGKSSLAFDTLLAEGQRQYIQSLSVYARQFFDQLERPDVDRIEGLQPTVAIDQRQGSRNPRSTVATITEIYDYLRLLMARVADVFCHNCGAEICQQTPADIEQVIGALPVESRVMIMAPVVRGRKGKHLEVLDTVRKAGFVRVRVDGATYPLEDVPPLVPQRVHDIEAVIDRIVIRSGIEKRLAESIRLAVKQGDGVVTISYQTPVDRGQDMWQSQLFNTRYACPDCKASVAEIEPRTFSFNSPYGACPTCSGLGQTEAFDPDLIVPDRTQSLRGGAIAPWRTSSPTVRSRYDQRIEEFVAATGVDAEASLESWSDQQRLELFNGRDEQFPGVIAHLEMDLATARQERSRQRLAEFRGPVLCSDCCGARLRPEALGCRLNGQTIQEITAQTASAALEFFTGLQFPEDRQPIAAPIVTGIVHRLEFLNEVGADYLTLDRSSDSLSGGELQRVRLATGIGSGLVGVTYLLDEPSIGLHPRDNDRLIGAMRGLQQQANSVVVVEHDEAVIREADHVIDIGPEAGEAGGHVVATGTVAEIAAATDSITGAYLAGRRSIAVPASRRREFVGQLQVVGASHHNLQDIDVDVPLGAFVCVTGVSGSGKSSLVIETLGKALARRLHGATAKPGNFQHLRGVSQLDRVVQVDQAPIGRSPRSNAATYSGVFDLVRKVFAGTKQAKSRGFKSGRFSFNVKGGRCEQCQGQGLEKIEMNFLPDLFVSCPVCHGTRFNRQTLSVRYRDRSIADVLALCVNEAVEFFENHPAIHRLLVSLSDVGLGYLTLGQPSTTLSGGESQRIKLATELGRPSAGHTLYILDEPTTGLHMDDIRRLIDVLNQLVDQHNTVLVIEHNLDVMKSTDWIIDLGPEGGAGGGHVVAVGTPEQVAACDTSYTGRFLRPLLEKK